MVRLASGIVMGAVALAAIVWLPPLTFRVAVCVLAAAAAFEYAGLAGRPGGPGRWIVVVLAALSAWAFADGPSWAPVVSLVVLAVAAAAVLGRGRSIPSNLAAVFGIVYLGIPLGLLVSLRGAGGWRVCRAARGDRGRERFDAGPTRAACLDAGVWRHASARTRPSRVPWVE